MDRSATESGGPDMEERSTCCTPLDGWLRARERFILPAVLLIAVAVRVVYFLQLSGGPCMAQHRWNQSDMHFFSAWADVIRDGDLLTNRELHPVHEWHQEAAQIHFEDRPEEFLEMARDDQGRFDAQLATQRLWNQWYGGKRFHQEPVYPYMIAAVRSMTGSDVAAVFITQMLIGVVTTLMIYGIARTCFGSGVAVVAALMACGAGPLVFYEMTLLRAPLITCAGLLLVALAIWMLNSDRKVRAILFGVCLGAIILLKSTFAIFGALAACLVLWKSRTCIQRASVSIALIVAGTLIAMSPGIARNAIVGAPLFGFSSIEAVTFIQCNADNYDPSQPFADDMKYTPKILGETQGGTLETIWKTLLTHPNWFSYMKLIAGKFASLMHWYEKPNNANFYYYGMHAPVLKWLFVRFSFVAPCAVIGVLIAIKRGSSHAPLVMLVLSFVVMMMLSYVLSRFRIPLLAALIPFAAVALVAIINWIVSRSWIKLIASITAIACLMVWMLRPLQEGQSLIRASDHLTPLQTYYEPLAREAAEGNRWHDVADIWQQALAQEPGTVREAGFQNLPQAGDAFLVRQFAVVHRLLAEALGRIGENDNAAREMARYNELLQAAELAE